MAIYNSQLGRGRRVTECEYLHQAVQLIKVGYNGTATMVEDVNDCSTVYSEYRLLRLRQRMSESGAVPTPTDTMAVSSQPKLEMITVRV